MGKRKYTHMGAYEERIKGLREEGRTKGEIAEELGLEIEQVKNWIGRQNRKERERAQGIIRKGKGRPRIRPLSQKEEYEQEIARLKMENKLLRDFLRLQERK